MSAGTPPRGLSDRSADNQLVGVSTGVQHSGASGQQPLYRPQIPRQLPPKNSYFTNRKDELALLDRIAQHATTNTPQPAETPALAVITGLGGIGKSALALAWATRSVELFPDGQLYADLRGFTPGASITTEEVLAQFLRSLGIPAETVPVELSKQTTLFRTITSGLRLSIIIDNALSAAQVRPLLPASAHSMVLVTSRSHLADLKPEEAQVIELAPLPQQHAEEFLAHYLGRNRVSGESHHVGTLASLCGRLPIALCVASARLAARPRWSIAEAVDELAQEHTRLAHLSNNTEVSLGAAFDVSYRALPDNLAQLYRLVSLHPGPDFGVGIAAAAAEIPETEAQKGLIQLKNASLIEEIGPDRYRFHDLVRLHGQAQVKADEDSARMRITRWFLHQMTRADMAIIPDRFRVSRVCDEYRDAPALFASQQEAVAWLDSQLPNFIAVLEDAVARGWNELAWEIAEALWELFLYRKHYRDWIATHKLGIVAAMRCGDKVGEAHLRCQLARAYMELYRFADTREECLIAEKLALEVDSQENLSVALQKLGVAANELGDPQSALDYFQRSLVIEQDLGSDRGVALRYRRIGETLLGIGRNNEAFDYLDHARAMFLSVNDERNAARVVIGLAQLDARDGRFDAAALRLEQALEVLSSIGSAAYHSDALIAFGEFHLVKGEPAQAQQYFTQALELALKAGGPRVQQIQDQLATLASADSI